METTSIDVAKFNLTAFKTMADVRKKLLEAEADYWYRMAEVAQKRIEVEKDAHALGQLKVAYRNLQSALKRMSSKRKRAEREINRYHKSISDVALLMLGETLEKDLVSRAWRGYDFVIKNWTAATLLQMGKLKALAKHRKAKYYSRNRYPNAELEAPTASEAKTGWRYLH